jgi:hypothetical protein
MYVLPWSMLVYKCWQQHPPRRNTSITVPNEEQEEKRQQHDIVYRILQIIDESEQYWWWFRRMQIFVHGSEGKSSIIVHQGFSHHAATLMKNVAINKSLFDYYLYMNFICACITFCSIFFCIYRNMRCFCGWQPNLFLGGRLGRLVTTISFPSTQSQQQHIITSENNTKIHSRRRAFAVLTKPVDFKQSVD